MKYFIVLLLGLALSAHASDRLPEAQSKIEKTTAADPSNSASNSNSTSNENRIQADWVIVLYQVNWKNSYTGDLAMYVVGEFNTLADCQKGITTVSQNFSLAADLTARCTRHFH